MARSIARVATGSNRNRGVLMLAALFGVLSAALMFAFLSSRGGDGSSVDDALQDTGEVETVVVLARDVEFGTTITADMLTTKAVPLPAVLTGAVTEPDDLVGQIATAPLYAGEQVVPEKVTTFGEQGTLAFKVPEGMRALSLEVPHEAWINAGLPQPGNRVDILAITTLVAIDPLTGQEEPELRAEVIAEDIGVLAVAQSVVDGMSSTDPAVEEDVATGNGNGEVADEGAPYRPMDTGETYEESISVTLAVTPEQAARVAIIDAMKDDQGQYRILTRQQGDDATISGTNGWTLEDVFGSN